MRRGQAATEYSLVLAVIVIAVVVSSFVFIPSFRNGVMKTRVRGWIDWNAPMGDGQIH